MSTNLQRGEGTFEGIVILAIILVIVLTLPKEDFRLGYVVPGNTVSSSESSGENSSGSRSGATIRAGQVTTAPQAEHVFIGSGNAGYSYQPYEEYITIDNQGEAPVDITGWQLRNGKDQRPYNTGGSLQRFSADIAAIPQAAPYLSPYNTNTLQNVVLKRGERAIVTTGLPGTQSPYKVTSFKENICSGYLENMPEYSFVPALNQNCPRPALESGLENLDIKCREFISYLPSCQAPKIGGKDLKGDKCPGCVNGRLVSSTCQAFIEERFSYQGCIAHHGSDPNFSGRTWRIFLNRGWEMWAEDYESIELFNNSGQLVDFENY